MKSRPYQKALIVCLWLVSSISFSQVPVIREVMPNSGYVGQTIAIKGSNFNNTSVISFGGASANVISRSSQLIEVEVPSSATYDHITVTNTNTRLSGYSPLPFMLSFGGNSGLAATDFAGELNLPALSGLYDLCVSDLNGDNKNDIATSSSGGTSIQIYQNTTATIGSISMSLLGSFGLLPAATSLNIKSADLTGDNLPELILSESNQGASTSRIFILTNTSSGAISFGAASYVIDIPGSQTKAIEIMDVDLDGKPDLVITDQSESGRIAIVRNISAAGIVAFDLANITYLSIPGSVKTAPLEVADFNNDAKPDIIVGEFFKDGVGLHFFRNISSPGSVQFSSVKDFGLPGTVVNLRAGDINKDGKIDLVATRYLSLDAVYLINQSDDAGEITFSSPNSLGADQRPWGLDFGDLNGDGYEDVVIANSNATFISIAHQSGSLDYQSFNIPLSSAVRNIKTGDLDLDGKPDIVYTGFSSDQIGILINQRCISPIIDPVGPFTICTGNPLQIMAQKVVGATYGWMMDGAPVKTGVDNFYDVNTPGSHTYTVSLTQGACSATSDPVQVEVSSPAATTSPNIDDPGPVCITGDLVLNASGGSNFTLEWRGPGGFTSSDNPAMVSPFQLQNTGRYFLDIYSGSCLLETKSIVVEAVDVPEFNITPANVAQFCEGEAVNLSVNPFNPASYDYQWYKNNTAITGETGETYSPSSIGEYYVGITDKVNGSCPVINSNKVDVDFLSAPTANFSLQTSACINQNIAFNNSSVIDTDADVRYNWDFGDSQGSTQSDPTHSYSAAGDYTVKLKVSYNGTTCTTSEISKNIEILPGLGLEIQSSKDPLCLGDVAELSLSESYDSYEWSTGETTSSITVDEAGTYSVKVTGTNVCLDNDEITLNSFPEAEVSVTVDKNSIAPGETVQLMAEGLNNYLWSPAALVSNPTVSDPLATVNESTVFTVEGEDENGCIGTGSIEVLIQTDLIGNVLKPKNFFSPNNDDNINSVWIIEKIEQFPQCKVTVVDQTGNIVMESIPYQNNWDGTNHGQPLPNGVYYFIIKCDGNQIVKSGSITLLK